MDRSDNHLSKGKIEEVSKIYLLERRTDYEIINNIFDCLNDGLPRSIKQLAKETYSNESTIEKWINYILFVQNKPEININGYIYSLTQPDEFKIKIKESNFKILNNIYRCLESGEKWSISKIHRKTKYHKKTIKTHLNFIKFIVRSQKIFQNGDLFSISQFG